MGEIDDSRVLDNIEWEIERERSRRAERDRRIRAEEYLRYNPAAQRLREIVVPLFDVGPERQVTPPPFEGEISRRAYPNALRPSHVFNAKGGWMTWDAWLRNPHVTECAGMLFEDGTRIGG